MSTVTRIIRIQEVIDGWRVLGSKRLANGTEVLAEVPEEDGDEAWMHAVFPGLREEQLCLLEQALGHDLPPTLRGFYRGCGGMTLFSGAFTLFGMRRAGLFLGEQALQAEDLVRFQNDIAAHGWMPHGAVAFACNGWDHTVHVAGMSEDDDDEVLRCRRADGEVLERHENVLACVEDRLYSADGLSL